MEKISDQWREAWAYFGIDVGERWGKSAHDLMPEDSEGAQYIYGWYSYLGRDEFETMKLPDELSSEVKKMGYLDAQDHYDPK